MAERVGKWCVKWRERERENGGGVCGEEGRMERVVFVGSWDVGGGGNDGVKWVLLLVCCCHCVVCC